MTRPRSLPGVARRSFRSGLALAWLSVALVGCGTAFMEVRPERLYERRPGDRATYRKVRDLELAMGSFQLFGAPIALPDIVASIDSEIQEAGADAVTNLEVESRMISAFVFGYTIYTARGDLIVFE